MTGKGRQPQDFEGVNEPEASPDRATPSGSLDKLYRRYAGELRGYVVRLLASEDIEPDDVVQAAFLKFERHSCKAPARNPRALLYSIVRNIVQDHRRHRRVVQDFARDVQHSWLLASYRNNPAYDLLGKQRLAILEDALRTMPERRRQMVLMNRFEHLSCEAIGQSLGVSTSTVQKQVVIGLAECRRALEQDSAGGANEPVTESI